eukprot:jgi/Psemu1/311538/fgenesh1_kg.789_\
MVPSGGYKNWLRTETINGITKYVLPKHLKDARDDSNTIDKSMLSLVVAILACLEKCPRDLRLNVVSNVVFCGDGVLLLPDLPRRVMRHVRDILQSKKENDNVAVAPESLTQTGYGSVPLDLENLESLASSVALTSCAPYRADWICWVGASLWAAVWNKYNDEETPIPWMFNNE